MSEAARRNSLLDLIDAGAGGPNPLLRALYAARPTGELEAAAARIEEARATAARRGGRIQALLAQDRFGTGKR